jgi:2-polyprenyl-3-methyl-5-hydroxy-6-metoxy-1,4-benzoquinol methylase
MDRFAVLCTSCWSQPMPDRGNEANSTGEMRYGFGKNWAEYIEKNFSEQRVEESRRHLADFIRAESLKGLAFLDIGCGSGLHSLAAHRMGAERILSFDYDHESVATTEKIHQYAGAPANWTVMQGSVLDKEFMATIPKSDIVYSWGVLHHTGNIWTAVRNATLPMKPNGLFYIALYSSDNYVDPPPEYWLKIKRKYNRAGALGRRLMELQYVMRFLVVPELKAGRNPFDVMRKYGARGMTYWTDVKDWLGGYPMEFASLQETQVFCKDELGLDLVNVLTGQGCTEYLFCRPEQNTQWRSIIAARTLVPLRTPFHHNGGKAYAIAAPHLESQADNAEAPRRSSLMLYENGQMLGLAHSMHDHIARFGKGRFSHYGPNLYFSASDNTDPNTNGRTYAYCEDF